MLSRKRNYNGNRLLIIMPIDPALFTWQHLHYWLLVLAIVSLWFTYLPRAWAVLTISSITIGLFNGGIGLIAAGSMGILAAACYVMGMDLSAHSIDPRRKQLIKITAHLVFLTVGTLLATKNIPELSSMRLVDNIAFHQNAPKTAISLHYHIGVIGLFYFAFCVNRITSAQQWGKMLLSVLPIAFLTIAVIMGLGVALGILAFDPVFTATLFIPFLISNLLFVCLAEEAVFRGWLYDRVLWLVRNRPHAGWIALIITAVIFGLAHAKGGPWLILAAGLAGLGYGYARFKTGHLEAAMLTHFALNGFHFVVMTYPFLKQG